ncbi:hypothetical protein MMC30_002800 [Trapelia coarctata]|nr:hypothetical protein [Trapelia coarctata]
MCRVTTDDYLCGCLYLVDITYCDIRTCIYRNLYSGLLVDECANRTGGCSRRPTLKGGRVGAVGGGGEEKWHEGGMKGKGLEGGKGRDVLEGRHEWNDLLVDECEGRTEACSGRGTLSAGEEKWLEHEGGKKTGRDVLVKAIKNAEEVRARGRGGEMEEIGEGEEGGESEDEEMYGRVKVRTWWGLETWVGGGDERARVYAEVS